MTEEEIINGNQLIADFVGLKIEWKPTNHFNTDGDWEIECPEFLDHDKQLLYLYEEDLPMECLKFHSSWDWLMPVIEKIYLIRGVNIKMTPGSIDIDYFGKKAYRNHICIATETGISCCFLGVVDFIKWYKENK